MTRKRIPLLQKIFLFLFAVVEAGNSNAYLNKFCKSQIDESYEVHDIPKSETEPGEPLKIYIKFKVIDLDEIDNANMDYRLHIYFKMFWHDSRLKRNSSLKVDCTKFIWTPDLMFETAKSVHNLDTDKDLRIERTGLVMLMTRLSFKTSCDMNFRRYPFDTQHCRFSVGFMTTTDKKALLKWLDDPSSPFNATVHGGAIEYIKDIEPLQYRLKTPITYYNTIALSYANYTYLMASFTLERRLMGSLISIYVPSTLVVAISWVTFWLRPEAAPARVSLSITSLLTLCTQVQQYKAQLPSLNYLTAMDVWLFVCIFEVFATLLEFAVCYDAYISDKDRQRIKTKRAKEREQSKSLSSLQEAKVSSWAEEKKDRASALRARIQSALFGDGRRKICTCGLPLHDGLKMDIFCRKFFPLSFMAFVAIYWIYNLFLKT